MNGPDREVQGRKEKSKTVMIDLQGDAHGRTSYSGWRPMGYAGMGFLGVCHWARVFSDSEFSRLGAQDLKMMSLSMRNFGNTSTNSVPESCFQTLENGHFSAPGKWGRTQMGSDGLIRILTGLYFFSPVGVRLVPLKTHDFKGF